MKSLLTTLSVLTLATTTGNLINILNTIEEKTNITTNYIQSKTQQDTIYKNKNGEEIKTNIEDLSEIESKEVVQIGFYKNRQGEIQVARMPETIEKVPDKLPSEITSLSYMFTRAKSFNQDLSKWNVSNVTDMSSLFSATSVFNGNITNWNVSKVTTMKQMFYYAATFNQDLSKWNVSNVTDMSAMFGKTWEFNANITNWNVSKVTTMNSMFSAAGSFEGSSSFNQDLSNWDVSNVTDMSGMFRRTWKFNSNISTWITSNVTDMSGMFAYATSFNQNLSQWNVEKVKNHDNFAIESGIASDLSKWPKFNK
ncbi:BspA family leucine-rich repeat surface protein [Spiroplasma endosymbiont of Andrena trimmerana]|uniref:BspA family leucine-rich repeat surface protein n=1 Tax=Spiroplasma endosymbiont of Andrena trimmerana TaxID=3066316 RepID=UPI0030D20042